ncbi:Ribonucleoside-triphosphate reductase [Candidatus Saccharibacteria bacterium RAAC3_TM7_1]|nr:Ribonucleoside-triphosphate reductase [Candidatus Saccharibacteria bacterium RAAC3_TM7_1]HCZ28589.1 ribonucleoside-triphosphate reductase [Candidatus Saccharibacteria bacterium]
METLTKETTHTDSLIKVYKKYLPKTQKRDGRIVRFNFENIVNAIAKAMHETNEGTPEEARVVAHRVAGELMLAAKKYRDFIPNVEAIQDEVERQLMLTDYTQTAKAYILYREQHAQLRDQEAQIPQHVKEKVKESGQYFATSYQEFIFYQFYARWRDEFGRRETWVEAIDRFMDYMRGKLDDKLTDQEYSDVREAILKQEICPSMRLLWSAGEACDATNVTAYNCAYIAPTSWKDLSEIMYVSMCGAGCGFAVEPENVEKFPQIQKQTGKKLPPIVVYDDKEGWCQAFVEACDAWANGYDVEIDYSLLRPAGARLKTMGGRSSGPAPLRDLMNFTRTKMLGRQGRRLTTIDLHDIICQIGLIVVAGGVRRSALISLSSLDDVTMRDAKKGTFWQSEGQRSMANNSAVYETKPSASELLEEWTALVSSGSGERGIFNRGGLEKQMPKRRWDAIKDQSQIGVNPCGEIYLRSKQFCNLTSIVVRPDDTMKDLTRKIKLASLVGTYQATLTNFGYLDEAWKLNCEEEQLLGISITGYYDNALVRNDQNLETLRDAAVKTNQTYAKRFEVVASTAVTCVKPHGNSGQLLGVGSGMHPWFAEHYIRRVRISVNDPLLQLAKDHGVPVHPEVGYSTATATTMVLEFPVKAPKGAIVAKDVSALEMLEEWKRLKLHFTEHNPSVTIYVGEDEWIKVVNFVYENWDIVGGLSFLPRNDHVYQLAPYEEISKEEYEKRIKALGTLDFSKLVIYEQNDQTIGAKELACVGGVCEI